MVRQCTSENTNGPKDKECVPQCAYICYAHTVSLGTWATRATRATRANARRRAAGHGKHRTTPRHRHADTHKHSVTRAARFCTRGPCGVALRLQNGAQCGSRGPSVRACVRACVWPRKALNSPVHHIVWVWVCGCMPQSGRDNLPPGVWCTGVPFLSLVGLGLGPGAKARVRVVPVPPGTFWKEEVYIRWRGVGDGRWGRGGMSQYGNRRCPRKVQCQMAMRTRMPPMATTSTTSG